MGTNNNNENNLNKKLKLSKKFYMFKTKFSRRQLKSYKSTSSLSTTTSSSSSSSIDYSNKKKILKRTKLKFSVCGDSNCGKTSLLFTYIKNNFPITYQPTIVDDHEGTLKKP
jgi:GTPase SAR1 family protein